MDAVINGVTLSGSPKEIVEFLNHHKGDKRGGHRKGIDNTKAIRIYGGYKKKGCKKSSWWVYTGDESTKKIVSNKQDILKFIPDQVN